MRYLRRSKVSIFAGAIVATGVAAAVVVLTFVDALWLKPPRAVADPEAVFVVTGSDSAEDPSRFSLKAIREFSELALFKDVAGQLIPRDGGRDLDVEVSLGAAGRLVEVLGVTESYFRLLGLSLIGRPFGRDENVANAPAVAVMSYDLWQGQYQSNPAVVGSWIQATPESFLIVGIAPPGFRGAIRGERTDLWVPEGIVPRLASGTAASSGPMPMVTLARLSDGLTADAARQMFRVGYAERGRRSDGIDLLPLMSVFATPDLPLVVIRDQTSIAIMAILAALLLVASCATLTALWAVVLESRRHEFATRLALGASRNQVLRLVSTEWLATACVSVLGGLGLTSLIMNGFPRIMVLGGVDLARLNLSQDWRVFVGAVVVSLATVIVAGAAAWAFWGPSFAFVSMRGLGRDSNPRAFRRQRWILGLHVSVTLLLLMTAVTLGQMANGAVQRGSGFEDSSTLFVSVHMPSFRGWEQSRIAAHVARDVDASQALLARVRSLPGVRAVGLGAPPLGRSAAFGFAPRIVKTVDGEAEVSMRPATVSPEYFAALGVSSDALSANVHPGGLVVTRSLAEAVWPSEPAFGQWIGWQDLSGNVTGVVDIAFGSVRYGRPAVLFRLDAERLLPSILTSQGRLDLAIGTSSADETGRSVRALIRELYPDASRIRVTPGRELVEADLGRELLARWFLLGVSAVAALLALGSVLGLTTYVVRARKRDFGIMMALGADLKTVAFSAMASTVVPAFAGAAAAVLVFASVEAAIRSLFVGPAGVGGYVYGVPTVSFLGCVCLVALSAALRLRNLNPADVVRNES